MQLTKEQFEYWKSLPETRAVFEAFHKELNEMKDHLAMGGTIDYNSMESTLIQTIGLIGRIKGLSALINIDTE